jgi:hypothetical protein
MPQQQQYTITQAMLSPQIAMALHHQQPSGALPVPHVQQVQHAPQHHQHVRQQHTVISPTLPTQHQSATSAHAAVQSEPCCSPSLDLSARCAPSQQQRRHKSQDHLDAHPSQNTLFMFSLQAGDTCAHAGPSTAPWLQAKDMFRHAGPVTSARLQSGDMYTSGPATSACLDSQILLLLLGCSQVTCLDRLVLLLLHDCKQAINLLRRVPHLSSMEPSPMRATLQPSDWQTSSRRVPRLAHSLLSPRLEELHTPHFNNQQATVSSSPVTPLLLKGSS